LTFSGLSLDSDRSTEGKMDPREWLFDKRVVRRNLDKGVLTMKAYREYLKTTPNLEGDYALLDLGADEAEASAAEGDGGQGVGQEEKAD